MFRASAGYWAIQSRRRLARSPHHWGAGMPFPLPTLDAIESLAIPTPCTVPWSEMSGDDRSRYCERCRKPVFDLSAITTAEAAALLADPAGCPCVRFYRRPDGRVLTADCPVGLRTRIWRRLRRRAAWAASLFATIVLPACRTATQGLPDRPSVVSSQQPPTLRSHGTPSDNASNEGQVSAAKPEPGNAFAELAGNEFNAGSMSRVEFPRDRNPSDFAPLPSRLDQ